MSCRTTISADGPAIVIVDRPPIKLHVEVGVDGSVKVIESKFTPPPSQGLDDTLPKQEGAGELFAWLIEKVTGSRPQKSCDCRNKIEQMNEWGWVGCMKNRKTIMGWLTEEAKKRGHKIEKARASSLFLAAYKELKHG